MNKIIILICISLMLLLIMVIVIDRIIKDSIYQAIENEKATPGSFWKHKDGKLYYDDGKKQRVFIQKGDSPKDWRRVEEK